MFGPAPTARPRPMGGFNQSLGNFSDEHLGENDAQAAMQQKAMSQMAASATQAGGAGAPGGQAGPLGPMTPDSKQAAPRPVGTIVEEVVQRPAKDILKGLLSIFDLNAMLGIKPAEDDPALQAKKKQMLNRFNKLTEEEQQVAREKYQLAMKKKQQEEQEKQMRKQQEEQQKANSVELPSSTKKGPVGPGAKKPKAVQKLEQDRKTLSGPQSAN
ncbi:MAG TPA: hypothetical protein VD999_01185 [Vitreimonas sp.]|nr:hypothetical protein [Vitreimonas sp.]